MPLTDKRHILVAIVCAWLFGERLVPVPLRKKIAKPCSRGTDYDVWSLVRELRRKVCRDEKSSIVVRLLRRLLLAAL